MILFRILVALLGGALAAYTFYSALLTFVVPRSASNFLSGVVFRTVRFGFDWIAGRLPTYEQRDSLMAVFAPLSLVLLVPFWLLLIALGFSLIYWALGITPWREAFIASGSSLLTLGYATFDNLGFHLFAFSEAVIGLVLVAMLIAYLPTMYSAFSQRETNVAMLEVRAGWPPTAPELIWRLHGMESDASDKRRFWESWETWFTEIDESHTSLAALVFFRSPRAGQSWVVAAGVVLDAAAFTSIDHRRTFSGPPVSGNARRYPGFAPHRRLFQGILQSRSTLPTRSHRGDSCRVRRRLRPAEQTRRAYESGARPGLAQFCRLARQL